MCGISGIVSSENVASRLVNSIRNLEYRGYDSCGVAIWSEGEIQSRKNIGTVDEVAEKENFSEMKGSLGIAHTRWATHGGVTQKNSHPHLSKDRQFAIVHNGILSNYQELKKELIEKGYEFISLTDSEVFAHLMQENYKSSASVEETFQKSLSQVEGSFAVGVVSTYEPGVLYGAKQDSPLIVGVGKNENYLGSDINAFLDWTKDAIYLDDGEYVILTKDTYSVRKKETGEEVSKHIRVISWDSETTKKGGYSHYMLKEIFDQPQTIKKALQIEKQEVETLANMIQKANKAYLMGVGTTYYVGLMGQYYFSKIAKTYLAAISSDEFSETAILSPEDMVLSISQSGETYDTKMGLSYAQKEGAKTAGIVNVMGSSISMLVDHVIMQGSGAEICVVSTKAAFSQMIILLRTALELGLSKQQITQKYYQECYEALEALPEVLQICLNEQSGFIRNMARASSHMHNWLFLGCGEFYPIAMESALKMKEVTYIHSEGMPAGFLKHGTLAMIDENIDSLFFVPLPEDKKQHQRTLVAIEEIKARGGKVLGFCFTGDSKASELLDIQITLPKVHPVVAPLLQMVMAQLFSYYTALELGRNIDKPRNLAKSVTVA